MTAVRTRSPERLGADLPERRSAVGAPEVVDPSRTTMELVLTMACVVAGLALTLWALVDSLHGSTAVELPRLEVPQVESLDVAAARAQLEDAGFAVQVEFQPNEDPTKPKGMVIGQKPLAGSKVEQGELVVVLASDGPLGQSVPDIAGQQANEAIVAMQASGMNPEIVPTSDEAARAGEVLGTDPAAGHRVPPGGVIKVLVSSGPAPRIVPQVIDRTEAQALADIGRAGLAPGKIDLVYRADLAAGTVFDAKPAPGAAVPRDTPVDLSVAGPKPVSTVPYLVGLHQSSAEKVLRSNDLGVRILTSAVQPGDPLAGRVIAQKTPPQAEVPPGSVVEITVAVAITPTTLPPTAPTATAPG